MHRATAATAAAVRGRRRRKERQDTVEERVGTMDERAKSMIS